MEPIQWDVDSLDWKDLPAGEITERVVSRVQPGSIVLFHNAALHTPEALPAILETLLQEGYTFVPISELILPGEYNVDYTIDHTGRQFAAQTDETGHRHPPDKGSLPGPSPVQPQQSLVPQMSY